MYYFFGLSKLRTGARNSNHRFHIHIWHSILPGRICKYESKREVLVTLVSENRNDSALWAALIQQRFPTFSSFFPRAGKEKQETFPNLGNLTVRGQNIWKVSHSKLLKIKTENLDFFLNARKKTDNYGL